MRLNEDHPVARPILRLGTRRSLLAWAQSSAVARRIEALHGDLKVELVGIDTRGDKIQDVPLQAVNGKEFFVAELDDALRSGRVDFTVHSLKDLSLDRPPEFVSAAIAGRENPRDVVLFGPGGIRAVQAARSLRIGTSSPRRLENIPVFLEKALPRAGERRSAAQFMEIRGNVNTRLARVHEPEDNPRHLDAVVLAFAGLIRLWNDPAARPEMERLFSGVRWMILPLRECPAAPGQGALAVECRADDAFAREVLAKVHDSRAAEAVELERRLLGEWGGGCHQRFGATASFLEGIGPLLHIRGRKSAEHGSEFVEEARWVPPPKAPGSRRACEAPRGKATALSGSCPRPEQMTGRALFVANARAWPTDWSIPPDSARVWTAGTDTWFKLAERGVWVEGCAEGFGFENVRPTLGESVLGLPELSEWTLLTHSTAERNADFPGTVTPTYRVEFEDDLSFLSKLKSANHVYWGSGRQYDHWSAWVAADTTHACGPGRTLRSLRKRGIEPLIFPSREEWQKWVNR